MQILTYILSPLFHLYYLFVFLVFHPIIVIGLKVGGDKSRVKVVAALNFFLKTGMYITGASVKISGQENIPNGERPLIVASNHQSLYDIPIIGYLFASRSIDYIAKKSLGKYIPTISYNLRNGNSALVDRDNGGQSVREIFKVGKYVEANKTAICIFPEGTRTKDGKMKVFLPAGLGTLTRVSPSALVIPFAIKGHYELLSKSSFWVQIGQKLEYTILPAIDPKGMKPDELSALVQSQIEDVVKGA